ncbi:MAG: hypothetical protein IT319_14605 [Anaerolineae bacterium]|nr:hypothetical protein [Anaerolineae bacterium]
MLQDMIIKQIDHIHRLRLLYTFHLALYGVLLIVCGLAAIGSPAWNNALLMVILWLPTIAAHTAAQSLVETRARCLAYAPVPRQPFNYRALPVDIFDEQGRLVTNDRIDLLRG